MFAVTLWHWKAISHFIASVNVGLWHSSPVLLQGRSPWALCFLTYPCYVTPPPHISCWCPPPPGESAQDETLFVIVVNGSDQVTPLGTKPPLIKLSNPNVWIEVNWGIFAWVTLQLYKYTCYLTQPVLCGCTRMRNTKCFQAMLLDSSKWSWNPCLITHQCADQHKYGV